MYFYIIMLTDEMNCGVEEKYLIGDCNTQGMAPTRGVKPNVVLILC